MEVTASAPECANGDNTTDFGDFVSNEDEELDLEEVVEPWRKYDTNGTSHVFYPIYVGEVLNERYLVEHKIRSGGFSTVWMAHDLHDKKDVALKVMSLGEWEEPKSSSSVPLMGPCLYHVILRNMSMATRMPAARQLLEALESLHKAGIVHRDLNERNCMWGMVPLHNLDRSAKYEALGRPLKRIIPYVELWKQGELVRPIEVPENLRSEDFYLGDFGLAMQLGDPVIPRGYPPMQFCSPDRLHKKDPSFACGMWSYMIIFAELYLGYTPFPTHLKGGIVSGIVRCLGPLPEGWKGLYTHPGGLDSWYDQGITPDPKHDLASTIAYWRPDADPAERELVHSIMNRVFTYSPEERLTATQLLQDPSFRAIMDKYGC
ncbi:hypothetical protein CNMCM8980_001962 [Aspergillus fumigatiaffinis]|nr:hypothetical protein CNMCM8980_001962 [Aspergillus fumigatiaffinis]